MPDTSVGRVSDQLCVYADPRFGDAVLQPLADELQGVDGHGLLDPGASRAHHWHGVRSFPRPGGGSLWIRATSSAKEWQMDERRAVAFEFERVTVVRAGRRVLDEVTARIPADGITVVSGPSGAGKTTWLRLCNRLEIPDEGRLCYRGQPLDELDPLLLRRRVGMVFQRPTPFPGSVADNLAVAHPDADAEELSTALKRVALDPGLLGQEARTLSGGELQRMCLARTLVTQPETLLLDEPTSALDQQPKRVFERTARDLAAQGITIVWVTHDDAQASRVADRIYQLRGGHLTGATAEGARP
jgi:UDP-glucose/iron transport system ATP-binding protein